MNTLRIVMKELKQDFGNPRALLMGLLFPVILILILGSALSGAFNSSLKLKDIKVIYADNSKEPFKTAFNSFLQKGGDMGVSFSKINNIEDGIESIKKGKYTCFIEADENSVKLYKNDTDTLESGIVESAMELFLQRYSTISEISKVNPKVLSKVANNSSSLNLVKQSTLGNKRTPGSMDYYSVTMITLVIMYSSLGSMYAISGERRGKTLNRLLSSPIKKGEILLGKILGNIFSIVIRAIIVIFFTKYVFKAYWGSHIGVIILLIIAMSIMAVSISIGMSFVIKNEAVLKTLLNMASTAFIFLGGGYFPIGDTEGLWRIITSLSPIKWVNSAILQVIYSNDFSTVGTALIITLGISAIFTIISTLSFRKELI